jgi:hypothetical protein
MLRSSGHGVDGYSKTDSKTPGGRLMTGLVRVRTGSGTYTEGNSVHLFIAWQGSNPI